jgi:hypothetical protein
VRADPLDTIIDNTVPILRLLDIQPGDYAEFLSLGYADAEAISDLDALVSYVAEHTPHRLPELRHVIAVDSTAVAGGLSREH